MASLQQLYQSRVRTFPVPIGDEVVNVSYYPLKLTPAAIERIYADKSNARACYDNLILEVVGDWDLLDENGEHCPVTADFLKNLPVDFVEMVNQALLDDRRAPTDEEKKD
jgi:hypothetical protein